MKIPVERKFTMGSKQRAPIINPPPGATWLVATVPLDENRFQKEDRLVKRGEINAQSKLSKRTSEASWIRFGKKQSPSQRAQVGDMVIQMWRNKRDRRVAEVFRRAPIISIEYEPDCVRIFYEEFRKSQSESLDWGTFQKIAKDAGVSKRRLGKRSIGMLSDAQADALESLWKMHLRLNK